MKLSQSDWSEKKATYWIWICGWSTAFVAFLTTISFFVVKAFGSVEPGRISPVQDSPSAMEDIIFNGILLAIFFSSLVAGVLLAIFKWRWPAAIIFLYSVLLAIFVSFIVISFRLSIGYLLIPVPFIFVSFRGLQGAFTLHARSPVTNELDVFE